MNRSRRRPTPHLVGLLRTRRKARALSARRLAALSHNGSEAWTAISGGEGQEPNAAAAGATAAHQEAARDHRHVHQRR